MKKMRKVISLIVALAFLFSIAAPAMAAEPTAAEKAGNRLLSLKIIEGYTDGTLGLDKQITRAEIAVILAKASGMATAAEMLKDTPSKFSDVKAGEWYTGWINLAASQGWVKGDPQGTFRPNDPVSYREIVTMVMKILGYNDNLPGDWPTDYLAKAASLGITKGISFDSKAPAVRGDVFTMTSKALDTEVVTWDADKSDFVSKDGKPTLLEDKHDVVKIEEVRVTEVARVNSDLKENQLKVGTKKYTLLEGDPMAYFGKEVDIWVNDDDEILAISVVTDDNDIIYDTISDVDTSKDRLELKVKDDYYDVAKDAVIWLNGEKYGINDLDKIDANSYGRIILNDSGDIVFANLYSFEVYAGVVTKADGDVVEYKTGDSNKKIVYDNYDNVFAYDSQFNAFDVSKIAADNVIYAWENDDDELILVVVGQTVNGKLEKANSTQVTVDGTKYDVTASYGTVSSNGDDDIVSYNYTASEVKDLVGESVTVVLDINGDVRHIRGDAKASSGKLYGILTDAGRTSVTIFNSEGKEATYDVEKRVDADPYYQFYDTSTNVEKYVPVQYELTKDGKIKEGSLKYVEAGVNYTVTGAVYVTDPARTVDIQATSGTKVYFDKKDYIKYNGNSYFIGDKTVIMKFVAGDDDDPKIVKWSDIEDKDSDSAKLAIVGEAGKEAKFVVFYSNYDAVASDDTYYGVVTAKPSYNGDDYEIQIDVVDGDGIEDGWFALDQDTDRNNVAKGNLIKFSLNSSGKIKTGFITQTVSSTVYTVDDVDGRTITLGGVNYRFDSNAVVYTLDSEGALDKAKSYSDVVEGDKLIIITDKDNDKLIKAALIATKVNGTGSGSTEATRATITSNYIITAGTDDIVVKLLPSNATVSDYKLVATGKTSTGADYVKYVSLSAAAVSTNGETFDASDIFGSSSVNSEFKLKVVKVSDGTVLAEKTVIAQY